MEIGPLLPGRIPGSLVTDRLNEQLHSAHTDMTRLQDQIASGQKFFLPSESPNAAVRTIGLQKLLERKQQMSSNVESSQSLLAATEGAIASVSDALNKAKQLASAGIGDSTGAGEKQAMALEVQALIRQVVNAGNSTFRGRYLFGGSDTDAPPFTLLAEEAVRYDGDVLPLNSFLDFGLLQATNVDGHSAFGALTAPVGSDVNPALTLQTSLTDLYGGSGVPPGAVTITLSSPVAAQTIDLTEAKTIGDLKSLIENAFTPGAITVAVNVAKNGIVITPTAGTVAIADVPGGNTARDLNIASAAVAQVNSGDLDPRLSLVTNLADLNGGTGIGATAGNGLRIVNGDTIKTLDISAAVTVEDLLNLLHSPDLQLHADLNAAGNGFAISGRLSGVNFSIGENNGSNATLLGIRTMTAGTLLSDLNFGAGVPVNAGQPLTITRRDGTTVNVDLSGSITLQDILTKINAVDPGDLVASLNTVGNGISLTDNSGALALSVDSGEMAVALGMGGTEPGNNPAVPLVGKDPNPREVSGTLNLLMRLQKALVSNNNNELVRVNALADKELTRLTQVRGEVGGRLQILEDVGNRLKDEDVQTQEAISRDFDADLAQLITELLARQTAFEATLRTASQSLQLTLFNYL